MSGHDGGDDQPPALVRSHHEQRNSTPCCGDNTMAPSGPRNIGLQAGGQVIEHSTLSGARIAAESNVAEPAWLVVHVPFPVNVRLPSDCSRLKTLRSSGSRCSTSFWAGLTAHSWRISRQTHPEVRTERLSLDLQLAAQLRDPGPELSSFPGRWPPRGLKSRGRPRPSSSTCNNANGAARRSTTDAYRTLLLSGYACFNEFVISSVVMSSRATARSVANGESLRTRNRYGNMIFCAQGCNGLAGNFRERGTQL